MSVNIDLDPEYHPEKNNPKWRVSTPEDGTKRHYSNQDVVEHVSDWMKTREKKGHK